MGELVKLFRHGAVYGFGQVVGKCVAFLLIPLYTHFLSQSDFGALEVLNVANTLLGMLLGLGVATAVMRFYCSDDDEHSKKLTVSTAVVFITAVGIITFSLLCWGAPQISRLMLPSTPDGTMLVRLAASSLLFTFSADIGWVYLQARQRSALYVSLSQLLLLLTAAITIYLVAFKKIGVVGAFWGSALGSGIIAALLIYLTISDVGVHFSAGRLKKLLRFGVPLTPALVSAFALNFSDRFFLQHFRGLSEVGIYAVAYKFGMIVSILLVQPFLMIWQPRAYEIDKKPDAERVFSKIFTVFSTLLISAALILSVFIREIFQVMVDRRFLSGAYLVPLIAFGYAAQGIGRFSEAGLLIRGKTHVLAAVGVASALGCLVTNFVVIRAWGMWGGALSTFLAFAFFAVANYRCGQRYYAVSCELGMLLKVWVSGAVILLLSLLVPADWALLVRILSKAALLGVFVLSLLKFGVLGQDDLAYLWNIKAGKPQIDTEPASSSSGGVTETALELHVHVTNADKSE